MGRKKRSLSSIVALLLIVILLLTVSSCKRRDEASGPSIDLPFLSDKKDSTEPKPTPIPKLKNKIKDKHKDTVITKKHNRLRIKEKLDKAVKLDSNLRKPLSIGSTSFPCVTIGLYSICQAPDEVLLLQSNSEPVHLVALIANTKLSVWTNGKSETAKVKLRKAPISVGDKLVFSVHDGRTITFKSRIASSAGILPSGVISTLDRFAVADNPALANMPLALGFDEENNIAAISTGTSISGMAALISPEEIAIFEGSEDSIKQRYPSTLKVQQPLPTDQAPIKKLWLGMQIQEMSDELAASFALDPSLGGVLVTQIYKDGPAEKAGLQIGDVLLSMGTYANLKLENIPAILESAKANNPLPIAIWRQNKKLSLTLSPIPHP